MSEMLQKRCKGPCGQYLPATTEYFSRNKKMKDGLQSWCKECRNGARRKPPVVSDVPEGYKRCVDQCGRILPATSKFFQRRSLNNDGLRNRCRECASVVYRAKHPLKPKEVESHKQCTGPCGRTLDATTEYFHHCKTAKNKLRSICKECISKKTKEYRALPETKEHIQKQRKEYASRPGAKDIAKKRYKEYMSRDEAIKHRSAYQKEYHSQPEIRELGRIKTHKRRAHKRSISGTHTPEQIRDQLKRQKYRCYYAACGHAKFQKKDGKYIYHIEHTYPISRVVGSDIPANGIDYLVLACPSCNLSKHDKFPWEWPEGGRLL